MAPAVMPMGHVELFLDEALNPFDSTDLGFDIMANISCVGSDLFKVEKDRQDICFARPPSIKRSA